jgi:uncharacterized protein
VNNRTLPAATRIDALDVLRGFALIGILAMNIEWFNRPVAELGELDTTLRGLDFASGWFVVAFIEGKFYKLFALLFGMSFAIMLQQAAAKNQSFNDIMTRRLLALLVIGMLHMVLLWRGDILHDYAVGGLALMGFIWLLRRPKLQRFNNPETILRFSLVMLTLPLVAMTAAAIARGLYFDHGKLQTRYQENVQVDQRVQQQLAEFRNKPAAEQLAYIKSLESDAEKPEPDLDALPAAERIAYRVDEEFREQLHSAEAAIKERLAHDRGSYWNLVTARFMPSIKALAYTPAFVMGMLLYIFLLGYWLIFTGRMHDTRGNAGFFRQLMWLGLGFGLPLNVAATMANLHPAIRTGGGLGYVVDSIFLLGQYVLCAGYVGLIITVFNSERRRRAVLWMAPLGRMALTNYLMHSLILSTLFYGYGVALFGKVGRGPQMLMVLAILALQFVYSRWWLHRYSYGPAEWAWRGLTYGKLPPMRKSSPAGT